MSWHFQPFQLWCCTTYSPCLMEPEDNDTCMRNLCSSGRWPLLDTFYHLSGTSFGWWSLMIHRDVSYCYSYYYCYCYCSLYCNYHLTTNVLLPNSSDAPYRDYRNLPALAGSRKAFAQAIWNCIFPWLAHNLFERVRTPNDKRATVYGNLLYRLACTLSTKRTSSLVSIWFRREARTDELLSQPLPVSRDSFHSETLSCCSRYRDTSVSLFLRIAVW